MSNLDWQQAVAEIKQLAEHLRKEGYTQVSTMGYMKNSYCLWLNLYIYSKLGAIGFCMGGALSLASAVALTEHPLQAAVTCYGTPSPDAFDVSKITKATAVQGHFGGKDNLQGFSDPAAGK